MKNENSVSWHSFRSKVYIKPWELCVVPDSSVDASCEFTLAKRCPFETMQPYRVPVNLNMSFMAHVFFNSGSNKLNAYLEENIASFSFHLFGCSFRDRVFNTLMCRLISAIFSSCDGTVRLVYAMFSFCEAGVS